jgi:hypothetical protein
MMPRAMTMLSERMLMGMTSRLPISGPTPHHVAAAMPLGVLALPDAFHWGESVSCRDSSHLPRGPHATRGGGAPYGLAVALYWWIPGMILALAYFYFLYSHLPETFRPEDGAH